MVSKVEYNIQISACITAIATTTQAAMMLCETKEEKELLLTKLRSKIGNVKINNRVVFDGPSEICKDICDTALEISQNRKSSTSSSDTGSSERISEYIEKELPMPMKGLY